MTHIVNTQGIRLYIRKNCKSINKKVIRSQKQIDVLRLGRLLWVYIVENLMMGIIMISLHMLSKCSSPGVWEPGIKRSEFICMRPSSCEERRPLNPRIRISQRPLNPRIRISQRPLNPRIRISQQHVKSVKRTARVGGARKQTRLRQCLLGRCCCLTRINLKVLSGNLVYNCCWHCSILFSDGFSRSAFQPGVSFLPAVKQPEQLFYSPPTLCNG